MYEGRSFDGNLSPFQPFVEIIRQLIAELRLQERRETSMAADADLTGSHGAGLPVEHWVRLLAVVNEYSGELLRIAPELRKYLPGEVYPKTDFGVEADYIFRALSAFFIELASLQPICLSFEDLQWADKSSLDLLRHLAAALALARRPGARGASAAPRLTIVASARTGYPQLEATMSQLRERRQVRELLLAPLEKSETRELIALRLNCRPDELSDDLVIRLHEVCAGNPFDLLTGVLVDLSEGDVLDAIDALLARRVFRETGNAGRVEFVHDLLRELPYGDLSAMRRRSLHRRVGELLERHREQGQAVAPSLLARHFMHAGECEKVFVYSVEAGEEAIQAYAFGDALVFLDQARSVLPDDTPPEQRYRLWSLLGNAHCCSKRTDDAIASYQAATKLAPDRASLASALAGIGKAQQQAGNFQQAKATFEKALRETGCWPSSRFGDFCKSTVNLMIPMRIDRKNQDLTSRRTRDVAFSATQQLAWVTITRSAIDYKLHALRLLGLARSTGDLDQLALAYSRFAMSLASFGFAGIAMRFLPRAESYAAQCQSPVLKSYAQSHRGMTYLFAGRLARAREVLEDAQAKLEKYSHWSSPIATHILQRLYAVLGDTANELAIAAKQIAFGEQTANPMARSWGEYGTANAMARSGRIGEAVGRSERAVELASHTDSAYTRIVALQSYGFVLLQASRYVDACTACEESLRLLSASPFRNDMTLPVYAILAESVLGPHWLGSPGAPGQGDVKRAWRLARQAIRAGNRFPVLLPQALRVRGRAAWALGKKRTSARLFQEAIDRADRLGTRYDLARAYLDASRVIPEKGGEYRRRGQQLLEEIGATIPQAERLPF